MPQPVRDFRASVKRTRVPSKVSKDESIELAWQKGDRAGQLAGAPQISILPIPSSRSWRSCSQTDCRGLDRHRLRRSAILLDHLPASLQFKDCRRLPRDLPGFAQDSQIAMYQVEGF